MNDSLKLLRENQISESSRFEMESQHQLETTTRLDHHSLPSEIEFPPLNSPLEDPLRKISSAAPFCSKYFITRDMLFSLTLNPYSIKVDDHLISLQNLLWTQPSSAFSNELRVVRVSPKNILGKSEVSKYLEPNVLKYKIAQN